MRSVFTSIALIVALALVVLVPKLTQASHKSKSYSKTVTKTSGVVVVEPSVSQSWSRSSRVSAKAAGHWEWVPDVPVSSSSIVSSSAIVANPVRVQQRSYSRSYSSGDCPSGGCPKSGYSRSYRKSKSYSRSW